MKQRIGLCLAIVTLAALAVVFGIRSYGMFQSTTREANQGFASGQAVLEQQGRMVEDAVRRDQRAP